MKPNHYISSRSGKITLLLIGSWLSCSFLLQAQSGIDPSLQEIREEAERRYLPSDELMNGEKYNYAYRSDDGTPFLEIPGDPPASVQISGKRYVDQRITYDIFNQVMVLKYTDLSGARGSLVLQHERVGEVEIGAYRFRWFENIEGTGRYGQVIGRGKYQIVFFWEKQYLPDLQNGNNHYFFSEPVRRGYLLQDGQMCPFKNKRSLVKCFPDPLRDPVKTYLKTNRIRVGKATPEEVGGLMDTINQQVKSD
jgi:hypothetical protein